MTSQQLERTAFSTSRLMEFFTEKELAMQIGQDKGLWPIALLKELIDNALDACEDAGITPKVEITISEDSVSVRDNGPGLPVATLEKSLDYLVRVSDKNHYRSPTRGQLGNALKCVYAAPFVANGEHGQVEVITGGNIHRIDVTLDRLAQVPNLAHTIHPDGFVKNGTFIKMHWPEVAGYLDGLKIPYYYNPPPSAFELIQNYSLFNPHATFNYIDSDITDLNPASDTDWRKWKPTDPTSPHWYNADQLRNLIAAYVSNERGGGEAKTVRAFVSEFAGLSGTAKQKKVTGWGNLSGKYLHDLIDGDDINFSEVDLLLTAMQAESRPVKPTNLGTIGKEHIEQWLSGWCDPESIRYKAASGTVGRLPFMLEVALGYYSSEDRNLQIVTGLNWSPTLSIPFTNLSRLLGEYRLDYHDPVMVTVHLACPHLEFTDRGKSRLNPSSEINEALTTAFKSVASAHKKAKRQADRNDKLHRGQLESLRKAEKNRELNIKDAAHQVLEKAYMKASSNGRLPANARQVMYAARPMVLELTGGKSWKNSSYFTQHLLPDFVDENPELTKSWDIVFDARGKLTEPHTGIRIDLGTLDVRNYVNNWTDESVDESLEIILPHSVETWGPANRYQYALFIEKEGFNELFKAVNLSSRYDLAIFSTKGMSVTAARQLVTDLSENDVTILVLHDFDKSGLSIIHTLKNDTRRWQYETPPNIVDLGLRLTDVEQLNLQSEPVEYTSNVNPVINLRESGASREECKFLVSGGSRGRWHGERVELNAMTSDQFITWLESKLQEIGVTKFTPSADILIPAYRRAVRIAAIQKVIDQEIKRLEKDDVSVPDDLVDSVNKKLENSTKAWDDIIYDLAKDKQKAGGVTDG